MTAGIPGTGPYSRLRDLRFQVRNLANELALRPMGSRTKKKKEAELRILRQQLRELNREIRNARQSCENGRTVYETDAIQQSGR